MPTYTDMRFESYASAHAVLIDTAGIYNLVNCYFDQSGTNDIHVTNSTGEVEINISGGGTVPTVTDGTSGSGTYVVNNNVSITITVTDDEGTAIENTSVRIIATETVGTITTGDELYKGLTNALGVVTTTINYEAAFEPTGLDISIKARQGSVSPYKVPASTLGVISSAGFTATITMQPDE